MIKINELSNDNNNLTYKVLELTKELENLESFNKNYNRALQEYQYGVVVSSDADYNYQLFSWAYDEGYFYDTIEYCEAARVLYADSNVYYQSSKQYFIESNKTSKLKYNELINAYINVIDSLIKINWAKYEACEYFESASNYYNRNNWVTGNAVLEDANSKIEYHDSLIVKNNEYVARLDLLNEII